MKNSDKILLLIVLQISVFQCLPIKEDEHVKDELHTKILDSVPIASLEDQPKPCPDVSNHLNHDEQGDMKHKIMFKIPATYVNNVLYANEYMVTMPQSAMEYLTAFNRNMYQNTYVRSLPTLDTLPSVYIPRSRVGNYYGNREPYYYEPELINKQKAVLIPVHLSPERSTSEEEFWAQLSQDAIMKNIIPTMDVPLPRDSYGQYGQLVRSPYPNSQELISYDGVIGYYPEGELRAYDYERPLLYRYKPKVNSERDVEDYPHTEIRTV